MVNGYAVPVVLGFHNDHLGTASVTTNQSKYFYHQTRNYPFGAERWTSGNDPSDYDFTGQRRDSFDLLDFNARFYDPVIGRFISADTIVPDPANSQDWNRYSYTRNNPIRFTDPTGHYVFESDPIGTHFLPPKHSPTNEAIYSDSFRCLSNCRPTRPIDNETKAIVGVICEWCDWGFTLSAWSQGDFSWWDVASFAPGLSFGMVRAIKYSDELGWFARNADAFASPLSREAKDALREEARDIWQTQTGRRAIWDGLQVHHRIPLEWAHLMPDADPNRVANLVGMTSPDHQLVSNAWTTFRTQLNGNTPTSAQVVEQALRIDEEFGHLMQFVK